jgi:hypothetical protein
MMPSHPPPRSSRGRPHSGRQRACGAQGCCGSARRGPLPLWDPLPPSLGPTQRAIWLQRSSLDSPPGFSWTRSRAPPPLAQYQQVRRLLEPLLPRLLPLPPLDLAGPLATYAAAATLALFQALLILPRARRRAPAPVLPP